MKTRRFMTVLALTLAMMLGLTAFVNAESTSVDGYCYFNGNDVVCDFESDVVADTVKGLEPGDDVTFTVKYENKYDETTNWYMRNEALATLEQSYDRTQNGGYTYILTDVGPDGKETVLFDNSAVGGEYTMPTDGSKTSHGGENTGEGLHQATNAADEWFFIQTLKKGQSGKTKLYVKFDGESEVNDYMDTAGELLLAYAVELDETKPFKTVKTGDTTNMLTYVALMLAALLMLIFAIMSYRKDRREERE
ncbi:MAG: hypothetical protein J6D57_14110 [Mogibacterium sp.]|nr:hypothetical protein [Mogibacterium sp.]